MDVDRGQLVGRRLKDIAIVMHLDKFVPVGGWAASGRDRRRFERFAEMCQDLPNRPRLWCKEMSRMSPPQAGHSSGNSSPTRAISLAQAIREVSWERGFWFASPQPPVAWSSLACPPVAASRCFPTARAVTAGRSGWFGANTP